MMQVARWSPLRMMWRPIIQLFSSKLISRSMLPIRILGIDYRIWNKLLRVALSFENSNLFGMHSSD
jgi:hypothetical protein